MGKRKIPVVLTEEEQQNLLDQFNERYVTSQRNKAMFRLMLNTGLRVSEIVSLRWEDVNLTSPSERAKDRTLWVDNSQLEEFWSGRKDRWRKWVSYPNGSSPL